MTSETAIAVAALQWLLEMDAVRATSLEDSSASYFFKHSNERAAAERFVERNRA